MGREKRAASVDAALEDLTEAIGENEAKWASGMEAIEAAEGSRLGSVTGGRAASEAEWFFYTLRDRIAVSQDAVELEALSEAAIGAKSFHVIGYLAKNEHLPLASVVKIIDSETLRERAVTNERMLEALEELGKHHRLFGGEDLFEQEKAKALLELTVAAAKEAELALDTD